MDKFSDALLVFAVVASWAMGVAIANAKLGAGYAFCAAFFPPYALVLVAQWFMFGSV